MLIMAQQYEKNYIDSDSDNDNEIVQSGKASKKEFESNLNANFSISLYDMSLPLC